MKVRNKFGDCGTKKTLVGLGWQASFLLRLLCRRNRRRASAEKKKKTLPDQRQCTPSQPFAPPKQQGKESMRVRSVSFTDQSVSFNRSSFWLSMPPFSLSLCGIFQAKCNSVFSTQLWFLFILVSKHKRKTSASKA